jgi:hypothetical protein
MVFRKSVCGRNYRTSEPCCGYYHDFPYSICGADSFPSFVNDDKLAIAGLDEDQAF